MISKCHYSRIRTCIYTAGERATRRRAMRTRTRIYDEYENLYGRIGLDWIGKWGWASPDGLGSGIFHIICHGENLHILHGVFF